MVNPPPSSTTTFFAKALVVPLIIGLFDVDGILTQCSAVGTPPSFQLAAMFQSVLAGLIQFLSPLSTVTCSTDGQPTEVLAEIVYVVVEEGEA